MIPPAPLSVTAAEQLGHELLGVLRERVALDGELLTRTVSIGVAQGLPGRDTTEDLLRRADHALLTAKGSGGNHVAVYSDETSLETEYRTDIELHLATVIENGCAVPALSARGRHAHWRGARRGGVGALESSRPVG